MELVKKLEVCLEVAEGANDPLVAVTYEDIRQAIAALQPGGARKWPDTICNDIDKLLRQHIRWTQGDHSEGTYIEGWRKAAQAVEEYIQKMQRAPAPVASSAEREELAKKLSNRAWWILNNRDACPSAEVARKDTEHAEELRRIAALLRAPAPVAMTVDDVMVERNYAEIARYIIGGYGSRSDNRPLYVFLERRDDTDGDNAPVHGPDTMDGCTKFIQRKGLEAALAAEVG